MKKIIYLLSTILFLSSCSGNVQDLTTLGENKNVIVRDKVSASAQQEQPKEEVSIDGVYSGSQNISGLELVAKLTINGNRWSASSQLGYDRAEYQNGVIKGKDLYDDSGMIKIGYVSGNTASIEGYPTLRSLNQNSTSSSSNQNSTSSSIIGNPIKVDNLEIAQNDFEYCMTWDDAKKACAALGDGWRLPTKEELNEMYRHKHRIGGFAAAYYWSSSECSEYGSDDAWNQFFGSGSQHNYYKDGTNCVRAVRALKN